MRKSLLSTLRLPLLQGSYANAPDNERKALLKLLETTSVASSGKGSHFAAGADGTAVVLRARLARATKAEVEAFAGAPQLNEDKRR